jgi:hypothetical protein
LECSYRVTFFLLLSNEREKKGREAKGEKWQKWSRERKCKVPAAHKKTPALLPGPSLHRWGGATPFPSFIPT